ncbi:hypothetical protein A3I48_02860 [Candidatus Daviesbacteria bacterium RIFCSPLOWO2_02_FULL_36_7]|uniref:DoxX family protein n=1 Tax=Candidatus Daviesbacteria bacterium RIFCSPLOWO2_02_FULL_36_7 TaxID=1797792 RepID=A0A1F5MG25_9BACT|nr:MAG: hypothetical protein A3I48_02860 [Candidatus Daviesbacteria bacterium RIFCSPLOWO2_02_FULL_36_7]
MRPLLFILVSIGLLWLRSSLSKFIGGNFAAALGETLNKTIDKNPYPLFKQFLISLVIPNSHLFGSLVMWGELLNGIAITAGVVLLLKQYQVKWARLVLIGGLAGGIFLNINFWLGLGSASPASDSLNLLMIVIQMIGIVSLVKRLRVKA